MNIDPQESARWLAVGQTLWLLAITAVIWLRKPGTDAQQNIKVLQDQMAAQTVALTKTMNDQHHNLDLRLKAVETDMKHMPTSEEMARLDGTVRSVAEQSRNMAEGLQNVRSTLSRIESFLLNEKGPR